MCGGGCEEQQQCCPLPLHSHLRLALGPTAGGTWQKSSPDFAPLLSQPPPPEDQCPQRLPTHLAQMPPALQSAQPWPKVLQRSGCWKCVSLLAQMYRALGSQEGWSAPLASTGLPTPVQTWLCSKMSLSKSPFLQPVFTPAGHGRGFALAVSWCGTSLLLGSYCKQLETSALAFFSFATWCQPFRMSPGLCASVPGLRAQVSRESGGPLGRHVLLVWCRWCDQPSGRRVQPVPSNSILQQQGHSVREQQG